MQTFSIKRDKSQCSNKQLNIQGLTYFLTVLLVAGTQIHYLLSVHSVLIQGELFPEKTRETQIVLKAFILKVAIRTII